MCTKSQPESKYNLGDLKSDEIQDLTIGETMSDIGENIAEGAEYGYDKTVEGIEVAGEAIYNAAVATG